MSQEQRNSKCMQEEEYTEVPQTIVPKDKSYTVCLFQSARAKSKIQKFSDLKTQGAIHLFASIVPEQFLQQPCKVGL